MQTTVTGCVRSTTHTDTFEQGPNANFALHHFAMQADTEGLVAPQVMPLAFHATAPCQRMQGTQIIVLHAEIQVRWKRGSVMLDSSRTVFAVRHATNHFAEQAIIAMGVVILRITLREITDKMRVAFLARILQRISP